MTTNQQHLSPSLQTPAERLRTNPRKSARSVEISLLASGWQTFSYGKLGELTENIRTFALPFENQTYTFKMNFEYDSWNRIKSMTYPDGEVVHYDYNCGGMLKKVYGTVKGDFLPQYPSMPHDSLVPLNLHGLGGQATLNSLPPVGDPVPLYDTHTYPYIDSIAYNEFELKSDVFYGNGTHALYAYDSLLRLLLLQSQTRTGDIMQDIVYTYDSVSNITGIVNSAAMLPNGLGGTYSGSYEYDNLYRLTNAEGSWQGLYNLSFQTGMGYFANGRVKEKNLAVRRLLNGHSDTMNYARCYYYENPVQRNTLTRVVCYGSTGDYDLHYSWTPTGNMDTCDTEGAGIRRLCWDEQNRLQGVIDENYLSYYLYDAAGDRTYKLTGKVELQNISGEWRDFFKLYNTTLYASPYVVATDKGYTKHYYAESERIASRIGGGRLQDLDQPIVENTIIDEKKEHINKQATDVLGSCLDARWYDVSTSISELYIWRDSVQPEKECYWYHPDHLGSSSWITYSDGKAVQHLHYLPWGEDFVDQRLNSFDGVRFTFSAKEKDSETGLSYFGSRYYSSDLSIWLSVDPMSDKYASLSPYTYCANNPVKLVDPNGDTIAVVINQKRYTYDGNNLVDKNGNIATFGKNTFGGRVLSDLNKLKNSKCEMIRNKLRDMMNSKHLHTIVNRTTPKGVGYNRALNTELAEKYGEGSDTETGYNPFATKSVCADGGYVSCATLAHELLGHGRNNDQGLHESDDHRTKNGIKFEEINAINVQNKVLVEYLQKPRSLVGSSDDAKQIPVNLINHYYTTKPK